MNIVVFFQSDFSEFNQCQTQLKQLYQSNLEFCQNEHEFLTYRILYYLAVKDYARLNSTMRLNREKLHQNSLVCYIIFSTLITRFFGCR